MNTQNILIIGSGGREHALAWKVAQSPDVKTIFVAPGNGGTAHEPKVQNINIAATDIDALVDFAQKNNIDLTIVGPEVPLAIGIVDAFQQHNIRIFGPTQQAAQLESSKVFAKKFMQRHNIPTATYEQFSTIDDAHTYIQKYNQPCVIKADGLAAGKGVFVCNTQQEAHAAIDVIMMHKNYGDAGSHIIIEELLEGEEVSFIVMTDGTTVLPLATSQDHKALNDEDKGPNTGGMGAYSPAPVITDKLHTHIMQHIINPTIKGIQTEDIPYVGFLYAGLMITKNGPKVLEYNCRLGDPETQPIMLRLQSDLVALCNAALDKTLHTQNIAWDKHTALGVVMASGGYPSTYKKGCRIGGMAENSFDDVKIFHAGTKKNSTDFITTGGRVVCVTALGDTVLHAQHKAYAVVKSIMWEDMYYRTDIGYRAIAQELQTYSD
jgi:phosphoribosylamine---glycine ligase